MSAPPWPSRPVRIRAYHERLRPTDGAFTDDAGVRLGWRWTPIDAVGIYVPGGRAAYPSTVLMNAVPAKLAGVGRVVMVTPPGGVQPAVMAAAAGSRCHRGLAHRRGAGRRRPGLWRGSADAGGQDRRAGQRLCHRRQAPGLRRGRHRLPRRAVRGRGGGGRRQPSRLDRRRPPRPGRTRPRRPVDPDHRQRGLRDAPWKARWPSS